MDIQTLVDALVVVSVVPALAIAPRILTRHPGRPTPATRHPFSPAVALALVTGLVYVNQLLFTLYLIRTHGGDPAFIARYLPPGWFDVASGNPFLRGIAAHVPAPGLLAPSVLRVQAFCELPFVLLAFATVVRWLDADLYRGIARSALLPLACATYTAVFCLVEWDLRNPYTVDDVVIRCVSAVLTPPLLRWLAHRDTATTRVPASVPGLLVFTGSLGALGALVLVVYDTALLYNLGRLPDRLPLTGAALAVLLCLRATASRLPVRAAPTPVLSFAVHALRRWLTLFFVPALVVRYGLLFGTPALALAAGGLVSATACVRAGRDVLAETPGAPSGAGRRRRALLLVGGVGCALLAGTAGAAVAIRLTPGSYAEVALLSALAGFMTTCTAACALIDPRLATALDAERPASP